MILPDYKEEVDNSRKSQPTRTIKFDKVTVYIYGNAKYSKTEIKYHINSGCRRRNINLSMYIKAINDYLISNPFYGIYDDKVIKLSDYSCIKCVEFHGLKISDDEFQIINEKYPNIYMVMTNRCTIYKKASIGCLKCHYHDYLSRIMSLDSLNGFSGRFLLLKNTCISDMNKNVLNLSCDVLELYGVNLNYEKFFLTTNAPKLRKIKIHNCKLSNKDLLFISGFYNLEYIDIIGMVENYNQIKKLERLRVLRSLLQSDVDELEKVKDKRSKVYLKLKENGESDEALRNYLMYQYLIIQNQYIDFLNKLYVPRLERVKWENKMSTYDLERIREELINISNMPGKLRKNISREVREYTIFDSLNGLEFEKISDEDDNSEVLLDSRPFDNGGIQYYVKRKKIIIE